MLSVANPGQPKSQPPGKCHIEVHFGLSPPNIQCWKRTSFTLSDEIRAIISGMFHSQLLVGFSMDQGTPFAMRSWQMRMVKS